ncbi:MULTISPECIES: alpha/beta hydrolase [unclassified Planococcus (in: firmicutes)]|uniref:alpha/beta hydrolase n=1 Tax=unclassified Planococcus (in: firmicutes) TaxID=2662419 RepID=UPI000C31FF0E|nr:MULTISPECIES: phospholipase [unclassified Planococcus (in: firmicutes)]AUD14985.1 phospholipase [Planococcus sp. MB-3u-03]PKG47076.1 phospholipase [Planococcus sp. Urea-trap-24]PKG87795.1 phospholipase [Planococcus sp. Urea-3u-39]PKH35453.1 phospholipase [Planococcus sp. MB-3u-09]
MDYFSIDGTADERFVLFHGTGGNEYSLLQIAGDINPNAHILSFTGPVGEGAERRFFRPLSQGRLDRADFEQRVADFLNEWRALPDSGLHTTFIGFSNGANFLLGVLEQAPDIAEKVVLMHPSNLGYHFSQGSNAHIFLTAGATDPISVPGDVMKLAKQLETPFPNTHLQLLDGAHQVSEQEIDYLKDALAR